MYKVSDLVGYSAMC